MKGHDGGRTEGGAAPAIMGVSQSTLVKMRAELYRRTPTAAKGPPKGTGKSLKELLKDRNAGVDERIVADVEEMRKERDVEGRLRAKAELYDKLRSGAVSLDLAKDSNVDFEAKVYGDVDRDPEDEVQPREGLVASIVAAREAAGAPKRLWAMDDIQQEAEERRQRQVLIHTIAAETERARAEVERLRSRKRKRLEQRLELVRTRRKQRRIEEAQQRRQAAAAMGSASDTDSELGSTISSTRSSPVRARPAALEEL